MKRIVPILTVATAILTSCVSLAAPPSGSNSPKEGPVISFPKDKQRIGGEGDSSCPEKDQPCYKIRAEGSVPKGRVPFFAVEPLLASPKMWVQPAVHGMKDDSSFSGLIYFGEARNGAKQYFKIYLFACQDADRYREGEEILVLPKDCQVSAPVEVYRER